MATYEQIQLRRDSSLNWTASNPRLALGEAGIDMDLLRFKVGNGIDRWNELPFIDDTVYQDLDSYKREVADQVREIIKTIGENKKEAASNLDRVRGNLQEQITSNTQDLQKQIDANKSEAASNLESTRQNLQGQITLNKTVEEVDARDIRIQIASNEADRAKNEKELSDRIEENRTGLQSSLKEFRETRDRLDTRMDVIVGSATEDTEILDARVDSENVTHPNLGHNIRSIHKELLNYEAHESSERMSADEHLQEQVDTLADLAISQALRHREDITNLKEAAQADLTHEQDSRVECDDFLQGQIDDLADTAQATSIGLYEEILERRQVLNTEAQIREEYDDHLQSVMTERGEFLQEQIDETAEGIQYNTAQIYKQKMQLNNQAQEIADLGHEQEMQDSKIDSLGEQTNDLASGLVNLIKEVYRQYAHSKETLQRELAHRDEELDRLRDMIQDLTDAALFTVNTVNYSRENQGNTKISETLEARLAVIEDALIEGGLLVPSDTPPKTDSEIDEVIDGALAGDIEPDETTDTDDDREYYDELDKVFAGESEPEEPDESDDDKEFYDALDDILNP